MPANIREIRLKRRFSLRVAAEKIGIDREKLIYFENNPSKITLKVAISLVNAYEIDMDLVDFLSK